MLWLWLASALMSRAPLNPTSQPLGQQLPRDPLQATMLWLGLLYRFQKESFPEPYTQPSLLPLPATP
jgi:hypothetical protein